MEPSQSLDVSFKMTIPIQTIHLLRFKPKPQSTKARISGELCRKGYLRAFLGGHLDNRSNLDVAYTTLVLYLPTPLLST